MAVSCFWFEAGKFEVALMPLILKPVSPGFSELDDDIVAAIVELGDAGHGCGCDGNIRLVKGLPMPIFALSEDGLARVGVAIGLFPIARLSASLIEAVLDACDKLENAEVLAELLPKLMAGAEGESVLDPGCSVAFFVGVNAEALEYRSVLKKPPCTLAVEATVVGVGRVIRSKRLPP